MPIPSSLSACMDVKFVSTMKKVASDTMKHVKKRVREVPEPAATALLKILDDYKAVQMVTSVGQKVSLSVAYDLGIRDHDTLLRINNASTFGSLHSLLLDDLVDNKARQDLIPIRNAYLAHLLFVFYLDDIKLINPETWDKSGYKKFFDSEIETYSALFEEEYYHVDNPHKFDSRDLIAHKCSPIKAIVGQVLSVAGRYDIESDIFKLIEDASFAMCTLDDLLDWEEDLDRQRYTYPLQKCIDDLGICEDHLNTDDTKKKILHHIAFSNVYHELMKEVTEILDDCRNKSSSFSTKLELWFFLSHNEAMKSWKEHVDFLCSIANKYRS